MRKVLGGLLLAMGILIAGASGLCSLWLVAAVFTEGNNSLADISEGLPVLLVFGGVPFAGGIGLIVAGRYLIKYDDGPS